jgi:hypothetical protein
MSRALNRAVRGSLFVVVCRSTGKAVAYFGGPALFVYDLQGRMIGSGSVPTFGGLAIARRVANRIAAGS